MLEHLSSPGFKSTAREVKPCVPVVGIVPLNEEWTAVLSERWHPADPVRVVEEGEAELLVRDLVDVRCLPCVLPVEASRMLTHRDVIM